MNPVAAVQLTRHGERMAYRVFGDGPRTLLCVHGLYRNGHDFDFLAAALAGGHRVVTPDLIGRGDSDYARDPARYNTADYVRDLQELAQALGLRRYDCLGTSMGGMVGMAMAAEGGIDRLVLNDVGPEVALATLKRIGQRALTAPRSFASYAEVQCYLRPALAEWGELEEKQLEHLIRHSVAQQDDGWRFHYDPDLIKGYRWPSADLDLWPLYRAFKGPVLVFRGARSAVLEAATAARLRQEPNTTVVEVAGAGHAPALMSAAEIDAIRCFLG